MRPTSKPSMFLIFPWGLMSIILVLLLNFVLDNDWFNKNWSWISLVLIIPAAILENFKVGYSTMRIMFMKVLYSLLSFLLVGLAFGAALTGWHIEKFQKDIPPVKTINYSCLIAAFKKGQVGREEIIFNSSFIELSLSKNLSTC